MYKICDTSGYFLTQGVWERSQLNNHMGYHGPHGLLEYQLMCLRAKSEKNQFAVIHIYPFYETSETSGRGTLSCVSCISHRSKFTIEGQFDIELNRYHLNTSDNNGADLVRWAGVRST